MFLMLIIMTMMVMTVVNADSDSCTVHLCAKSCVTLKKRGMFRALDTAEICPVAVVATTSLRTATVVTMSFVLMLCSSFLLR